METMAYKKTMSATEAMRKLTEGKKHLQEGNFFSSIITLRDILNIFINIKHAGQNEKTKLAGAINDFQRILAASPEFRDLYGKVNFRENDFATSYDFLCQLIRIKEDEITDVLVNEENNPLLNLNYLSHADQKTTKLMISLVERGELSALRELVAINDGIGSLVLSFYNETGIQQRKSGNIEKAIAEYKKALSISPDDENLHYNLARAYIEIGQKKSAEAAISRALQINPRFKEGFKLFKYIQQWSR